MRFVSFFFFQPDEVALSPFLFPFIFLSNVTSSCFFLRLPHEEIFRSTRSLPHTDASPLTILSFFCVENFRQIKIKIKHIKKKKTSLLKLPKSTTYGSLFGKNLRVYLRVGQQVRTFWWFIFLLFFSYVSTHFAKRDLDMPWVLSSFSSLRNIQEKMQTSSINSCRSLNTHLFSITLNYYISLLFVNFLIDINH